MKIVVFCVNGAETFLDGFIQLTIMYLLCGLFDRVFIDWYWVGHTKAWLIPGTEDLMPYIHKKTWLQKTIGTVRISLMCGTDFVGIYLDPEINYHLAR